MGEALVMPYGLEGCIAAHRYGGTSPLDVLAFVDRPTLFSKGVVTIRCCPWVVLGQRTQSRVAPGFSSLMFSNVHHLLNGGTHLKVLHISTLCGHSALKLSQITFHVNICITVVISRANVYF